jgi:hypothetical protein
MLYLLVVWQENRAPGRRAQALGGLVFLSLTAPLLKLSGIIVPAAAAFALLWQRRYRAGWLLAGAGALGLLLFAAWGAYFDWSLFLDVQQAHQERSHSFYHFWQIFTYLTIGHYELFDPTIIVGMIGLFCLVSDPAQPARVRLLAAPVVVASFLFSYVAPTEAYGWYRYLLYPLLAMGVGYVFECLFRKRWVFLALFLPLLSIMLQHADLFEQSVQRRLFLIMIYGLISAPLLFKHRWLSYRAVFLSLLGLLFALETLWIMRVIIPLAAVG